MTYMYVLYLHSCSSRNLLLVTKKKFWILVLSLCKLSIFSYCTYCTQTA